MAVPCFHPGNRGSKPLGGATFFLNRYNSLQHSSRYSQGFQRLKIGFYAIPMPYGIILRHKKRSQMAPLFTGSLLTKVSGLVPSRTSTYYSGRTVRYKKNRDNNNETGYQILALTT